MAGWLAPKRLSRQQIHAKYRNVSDKFYCIECAEEGIESPIAAEEWSDYCHEMGFRDVDLLQPACKEHAEARLADEEPDSA